MRGYDWGRWWVTGRRREGSRVDRHLPYFAVLDALGHAGCPICHLVIRGSQRFLDGLLYESVTDPEVRARIREGLGFCNWHAWMLPKIVSAAAGVAAIHEDVLAQEIKALRAAVEACRAPAWWERVRRWAGGSRRRSTARCAACTMVAESTERHGLSVLIQSLAEPEFRQAFIEGFGLCLPHYRMLEARHPDHPNLPAIRAIQLAKLEALRADLLEFLRNQDYQHNREPLGPERDAWMRSIEMLVGKAHAFGPDRNLALEAREPGWKSDQGPPQGPQGRAGAQIMHEVGKDREAQGLPRTGTEADEGPGRRIAEGLRAEVAQLKAQLASRGSP